MIIKQHESAKDFFAKTTISLYMWVDSPETLDKFVKAYNEVKKINSDPLGELPRVGYNPETDSDFILFKFENNGTTITVQL